MSDWLWWVLLGALFLTFAYLSVSRLLWTLLGGIYVLLFVTLSGVPWVAKAIVAALYVLAALIFNIAPLRRLLIARPVLNFYRASMPRISPTERAALEAGTTWWDAELFTGRPRWDRLLEFSDIKLSEAEQAFIDGPVETLCAMLDDYRIDNERHDLDPEAWAFIKQNGFFGMIIPQAYGGKEFSASGHASVVMKIASRSISAALTVMIPNSVGPAKLLLKYGTDAQKQHYLPRLARGEEVPCFALTGPEAGSDAGALPDIGVVCRQTFENRANVLGVRINFDKRYITLGPVASLLGLAFKLEDPDHLLSERENLGITLALVPAATPGVTQGARHDPMHMAFLNGPISGRNVFVPIEQIIGGVKQAGNGWRMLIESLTDGRAISLPALSTAAAKTASRITGAYARIRRQFGVSIANFEGVEEALAGIAGNTYAMDAARRVTLAALDAGHKPAVISAIVKYNLTYRCRQVIDHAMEVHGGASICLGPSNPLGQLHSFPAVGITVEGANILTRNLITFGQGAIRCHPYLLQELKTAGDAGAAPDLKGFDRALLGHIGFTISNTVRALLLGLSGAWLARPPRGVARPLRRYYRRLTRMSAVFALVTDVLLLMLRGGLKRRERLSARMADVLSQLYLASTTLKHFVDQGQRAEDLPLVRWVCEDSLYTIQHSLDVLLKNLPGAIVRWSLRLLIFPLGRRYSPPGDTLEHDVAGVLIAPSAARERLTAGMYLPDAPQERVAMLENALKKVLEIRPLEQKIKTARRNKTIKAKAPAAQIKEALAAGVITEYEAKALQAAERARYDIIQVDHFAPRVNSRLSEQEAS